MAAHTEAPRLSKKRKLSKGKKKAWAAANITDLEEFLDDERRQRQTGGLVSEKSDEKLFFIDKDKLQKAKLSSGKPVSKAKRRNPVLRSTALLKPDGNIPCAIAPLKKNYRKGKRTQKILDSIDERAASQVRLNSEQQRKAYVAEKRTTKRTKNLVPDVTQDIWNDDEMDTAKVKRPKKLLASKPSKLPATCVPHPGASVNPSYDDHQDLLLQAVEKEDKKLKRQRQLVNALKLHDKSNVATKETYLAEMSAGLLESESDDDEEEQVNGDEELVSKRMPQRKTKKQRAAEAKLREQKRNKEAQAEKAKQIEMVSRLRSLKADIRKKDEKTKVKVEAKLKLKEELPFKTKRLGKMKFEEPDAEVKLSTELVKSLRQVKTEGNLLGDVYKSMMRRNILEPRLKHKKKLRYKRVAFLKSTHKVIT